MRHKLKQNSSGDDLKWHRNGMFLAKGSATLNTEVENRKVGMREKKFCWSKAKERRFKLIMCRRRM